MKKIQITFDLDWCPDFMIENLINILNNYKVSCIFFVTHNSKKLDIIKKKHKLGIHPNFLNTHSINKQISIVKKLIKIVPDAQLIRTHALHMNSNLIHEIFKNFPQLKHDLSTLAYKSKFISKSSYKFLSTKISRINYNWEDSIAIHDKKFNWSSLKYFGDKNIYNFHPIHIFYNTKNYNHYLNIKKNRKKLNSQKITDIDKSLINNKTQGVKTFFMKVLDSADLESNIIKKL